MAPIKLGFIGLSKTGWARSSHIPYLLKNPEKYVIVAICNTSVESAQTAINELNLPASTKAYGDPQALANDINVDMVVVTVRVDKHLHVTRPILKAGKDVYVEWPLGRNLAEAQELVALKKSSGVNRAIVGLQERQSPVIKLLRELVVSEKIGRTLSSTFNGYMAGLGGPKQNVVANYATSREIGANMLAIGFGHIIEFVHQVLGNGFKAPPKTLLANKRPIIDIVDDEGKVVEPNLSKNADDTLFLNGILASGVALSFNLRGGAAFKGTPHLDWRIYGEKGEIRITSPSCFLEFETPNTKVEVYDFASDSVEEILIPVDELTELGVAQSNIGRLYRDFAGDEETVCTFEQALKIHELVDHIYKDNGIKV